MLCCVFFTRINSSTEANMKDVYDFLLLVDMTFFLKTLSIKVDFQASTTEFSVCDFCLVPCVIQESMSGQSNIPFAAPPLQVWTVNNCTIHS